MSAVAERMTETTEPPTIEDLRARARQLCATPSIILSRVQCIESLMIDQLWTRDTSEAWVKALSAEWKLSPARIYQHADEAGRNVRRWVDIDAMRSLYAMHIARGLTGAQENQKYESVAKLVDSGSKLLGLVQTGSVVNVLFDNRTNQLSAEATELVREASRLAEEREAARWREMATLALASHPDALASLLQANDERCDVMPLLAGGAER